MDNLLRTLERLSYLHECVAISYTSEIRFELRRFIALLRSDERFQIPDGSRLADRLAVALEGLERGHSGEDGYREGVCELARCTREVWNSLIDENGDVLVRSDGAPR